MLEVMGLSAGYGAAQALWDVDVTVGDREIVSLVGPNGAGKSTFVNAISGLTKVWGGTVSLDGVELTKLKPAQVCGHGVAVVPEGRRVFAGMTVTENLDVGAFHQAARMRRDETLRSVHSIFPVLEEKSQQRAGSLSGGQQQMLAIGRALMALPRVLLLDEPSLGLAPVIVETIFEVIKDIRESGTAVLIVEQNVVEALELADRAYVLEEGRIVREGDASDLLGDPELQAAYFGM